MTGFLGALGEYAVLGIRMAEEEINKAGGVCRYTWCARGDCGLADVRRRGLRCTEESSFGRMGQLDKIGGNLTIFDQNAPRRGLWDASAA